MIQPQNIQSEVDEFLSLLHLKPEQRFLIEQNDKGKTTTAIQILRLHDVCPLQFIPPDIPLPLNFPTPCTVRHFVSHYLDFQSIPRRSFFELLAHFATDSELEREKLLEFTTAEGQVCECVCV